MPLIIPQHPEPGKLTANEKNGIRNGEPQHCVRFPVSRPELSRAYIRVTYYSRPEMPHKVELTTTFFRVLGRFYRHAPGKWQFAFETGAGHPILNEVEKRACQDILRKLSPGEVIMPDITWPSDVFPDDSQPFGPSDLGTLIPFGDKL